MYVKPVHLPRFHFNLKCSTKKSRVAQTKSPIILPKVICHFGVELLLLLFLYFQCKTSRKKKQIPLIEIVGDKFLHSMVAEQTLWINMYTDIKSAPFLMAKRMLQNEFTRSLCGMVKRDLNISTIYIVSN